MTRDDIQNWLDHYVVAWMSYDPSAIGDLFTPNAEYRYHPWDDPLVGREGIVEDWLNPSGDPANRDKPGSVEAHYRCYTADGDRAVAVGDTTYRNVTDGTIVRQYDNVWLLEFDPDGRCRSFIEHYMRRKR